MNRTAFFLIFLGLFLGSGVYSFVRQKMPKSLIVLLGIGSLMSLAAGVTRL